MNKIETKKSTVDYPQDNFIDSTALAIKMKALYSNTELEKMKRSEQQRERIIYMGKRSLYLPCGNPQGNRKTAGMIKAASDRVRESIQNISEASEKESQGMIEEFFRQFGTHFVF